MVDYNSEIAYMSCQDIEKPTSNKYLGKILGGGQEPTNAGINYHLPPMIDVSSLLTALCSTGMKNKKTYLHKIVERPLYS
jgi:hypothetical protein